MIDKQTLKKPSEFAKKYPFSSVFQKSEHETIACNIMTILGRTGDKFRPLTWDEYSTEREKDGNFSHGEKRFFEEVTEYCASAQTARLFSKSWRVTEVVL